jgi:hypothetical protein
LKGWPFHFLLGRDQTKWKLLPICCLRTIKPSKQCTTSYWAWPIFLATKSLKNCDPFTHSISFKLKPPKPQLISSSSHFLYSLKIFHAWWYIIEIYFHLSLLKYYQVLPRIEEFGMSLLTQNQIQDLYPQLCFLFLGPNFNFRNMDEIKKCFCFRKSPNISMLK